MTHRRPELRSCLPALLALSCLCAGCNAEGTIAGSFTAPSTLGSALVTAEPPRLVPEFLPARSCAARPPFRARFVLIVRGSRDVVVRRLRLTFTDRFGGSVLPLATPASGASSLLPRIPGSPPVSLPGIMSLPGSAPIPLPGRSVDGVLLAAGTSRRVPLLLEFGCGVPAAGVLIVAVDTSDRNGRDGISRLRVSLGD